MKTRLSSVALAASLALFSSCGGGTSSWTEQPFDVAADATLNQVVSDVAALSGLSFTIDPELQAVLDEDPPDLPTITGLTAAEVLTILQDTMLPEHEYFYEELAGGSIVLIPRFQQSADLSGADPRTFVEFDPGLGSIATLISEPLFEEECGGDVEETILDLLGDGGIYEVAIEVESDPGGHSEFIGDFPPTVEVAIAGHDITVTGVAPWVGVTGAIADDGGFTCSGSGTVAGFPDVSVTFEGTAAPTGLTGTLTIGAGGELPGGEAAVYAVHP